MSEALKKVDSAVQGVTEPAKETKKPRQSTVAAPGVYRIEDLGMFISPTFPPSPLLPPPFWTLGPPS